MEGETLLFFKLTFLIGLLSAEHCDRASMVQVREGNLGQTADFNWLGILKVHLTELDRIAMTGVVLIHTRYVLANADDVAKIPQNIFKTNSKVMFLAARNTPWFVKPASYVTHPDYEYSLNSIAVVELNLDEVNDYPLIPICVPAADTFLTSRYLYLAGFTDDNQILEKVIYKIQYSDKKVCEEFYNRAVVPSKQRIPSAYLCGYAPNSVTQCVWENGMTLVSNATRYYNLIGFGIYGPGCAAPTRFIELFPYFSWIKSVTGPDEVYKSRKKDANNLIPNIPIHELLYTSHRRRLRPSAREYHSYPFHPDILKFHLIKPDTIDTNVIQIFRFQDTYEEHNDSCSQPSLRLVYKEVFDLKAPPKLPGTVTYKLSLYDLAYDMCSCIRLTCVDCEDRGDTVLAFKEQIHLKDNVEMKEDSNWETPEEIFRYFPTYERTNEPKKEWDAIRNDTELFEAAYIKDTLDLRPRKIENHDLYIQFKFTEKAILKFEMLAQRDRTSSITNWASLGNLNQ